MREEAILAGFGGQGVIFMGKFLAYLGMREGKQVTFIPSYGAEVRGGTANCTVIISSEKIASPVSLKPSTVIVMNRPSLDKFESRIEKGGLLLVNSSLIFRQSKRDDLDIVKVPATEIATDMGNVRVANMVILGAYLAKKKFVSVEKSCQYLENILPRRAEHLLEINKKALRQGAELLLTPSGQ